jgi:hypothetical protein
VNVLEKIAQKEFGLAKIRKKGLGIFSYFRL